MIWNEDSKTSFTLLAAGQSARMKTDKAILEFQGQPWILRQAQEIKNSNVISRIVLVDQPQKTEKYKSLLAPLESENFQIQIVENFLENSSPSDSIFCAFQASSLPNGSFVSPIDVPFEAELITKLWKDKNPSVWAVKPSRQGHGGHPVWLSPESIGKFLNAPRRLDEFLAQLPKEKVQFLEVQSTWTQLNLNTPAEWQEFLTDLRGPRAN